MLIFRDKLSLTPPQMPSNAPKWRPYRCPCKGNCSRAFAVLCGLGFFIAVGAPTLFFCSPAQAQQTAPAGPVVVQPGAPGKPSKRLPPSTTGKLPPRSQAEVDFMQGMIMHHAQAVEMTALIPSHTENKDLRLLGARISSSQSSEMNFMKRWLAARGEPVSMAMPGMKNMDMSGQPDASNARDAYAGTDGGATEGKGR